MAIPEFDPIEAGGDLPAVVEAGYQTPELVAQSDVFTVGGRRFSVSYLASYLTQIPGAVHRAGIPIIIPWTDVPVPPSSSSRGRWAKLSAIDPRNGQACALVAMVHMTLRVWKVRDNDDDAMVVARCTAIQALAATPPWVN